MGKASRSKGARGERACVESWLEVYPDAHRSAAMQANSAAAQQYPDVLAGPLAIECKQVAATTMVTLRKWWNQALEGAITAKQTPMVRIHWDRGPTLVVMAEDDAKALHERSKARWRGDK